MLYTGLFFLGIITPFTLDKLIIYGNIVSYNINKNKKKHGSCDRIMLESTFNRKFREVWKKEFPDDYVLKMSERYHSGVPDILVIHEGYAIMVETKVGNNKPTELQKLTLKRISEAGAVGAVLTYNSDNMYTLTIRDASTSWTSLKEVVWECISCLVRF